MTMTALLLRLGWARKVLWPEVRSDGGAEGEEQQRACQTAGRRHTSKKEKKKKKREAEEWRRRASQASRERALVAAEEEKKEHRSFTVCNETFFQFPSGGEELIYCFFFPSTPALPAAIFAALFFAPCV